MSWQTEALERWYYSKPGWRPGSEEFRGWIAETASPHGDCLELGAGPGGKTSRFLGAHFAAVDGLDIDEDVRANRSLRTAYVYDGKRFPLADEAYDYLVADWVLEHVQRPQRLLAEAFRVLKPGGRFYFRTPNFWHYVSLVAWLTPHWIHDQLSGCLRRLPPDAHGVYPTFYRLNTPSRLRRLARHVGFEALELRMIEKEPAYGMASRLLFYPFLAYERIVNAGPVFRPFRANILGLFEKPQRGPLLSPA